MIRKAELVKKTYEKVNEGKHGYAERITQEEVKEVVDTLFNIIEQSLLDGEDVMITGICKFVIKTIKERRGTNFHTGERIIIPERRAVRCIVSESLNEAIREA